MTENENSNLILIAALQHCINKLENQLAELKSKDTVARLPRWTIHSHIEFIGDFDVVKAEGVNLSTEGISFKLSQALPLELQFTYNGEKQQRRAHLIWVKQLPREGYRFGLKFVPPAQHTTF